MSARFGVNVFVLIALLFTSCSNYNKLTYVKQYPSSKVDEIASKNLKEETTNHQSAHVNPVSNVKEGVVVFTDTLLQSEQNDKEAKVHTIKSTKTFAYGIKNKTEAETSKVYRDIVFIKDTTLDKVIDILNSDPVILIKILIWILLILLVISMWIAYESSGIVAILSTYFTFIFLLCILALLLYAAFTGLLGELLARRRPSPFIQVIDLLLLFI
jgi:hypothetical protein